MDAEAPHHLEDILALAKEAKPRRAQLTVVTRGGLKAGSELADLPRVEPFRWLDLDPEYAPDMQITILAEALRHTDRETVAIYRGDQRFVPRFQPGANGQVIDAVGIHALALPEKKGLILIQPGRDDPFFAQLAPKDKAPPALAPALDHQSLLALPQAERGKILETFLRREFATITGLALTDADLDKPLHSFGLDSLMAIQLRNRVEAELKISLSLVDFLKGLSLGQIVKNANQEMADHAGAGPAPADPPAAALGALNADNVENLSEGELDRFLQSLLAK